MKRGLVLSLGAALVAAMAGPAFAVVDVQLNLRYTDPNNPTGGGTWNLLAQSNTAGMQGLAGLNITIGGNLGVTGVDTPLAAITPNAAVFTAATSIFKFEGDATSTNIAIGDDLAGALVLNVGKGVGTPGNVAADDLFPANSVAWDNSALLASGSWTGARPTITLVNANEFNGASAAVLATNGDLKVRGDSVGVDGLKPGDANRDGLVNINDFSLLSSNYNKPGVKTWDNGDFNSSANVNINDFSLLSANYNKPGPVAPPIAAVPEPSSMVLVCAAAFAGLAYRSKQN